jgi:diketogulonate reductase-like aldo/keto reductase
MAENLTCVEREEFFTLNNGNKIPVLGLGTFNQKELSKVAKASTKIGYKLFDTSPAYKTEKSLSEGLYKGLFFSNKEKRKEYSITTKLFLSDCFDGNEYRGLKNSLRNLSTDYIDTYLLHWAHPDVFIRNYKEMEKFYKDGLVKNIGVCNMEIHHLEKLINECEIIPTINQVEVTPMLTQKPLINFCNNYNILVMTYTPFARMHDKLFNNSTLNFLAEKYNKKITQIILRWNIQQGRCVIPKTSNIERLKENFNIFDFKISEEDLLLIDKINEDFRVRFHPDIYPIEWGEEHGKTKKNI